MGRPPSVICYICQRQFGTASIGIHEKTCLKRWQDDNEKLPASQRRPEPVKPKEFAAGFGGGGPGETTIQTSGQDPNIDQYNAAAIKSAQANLSECPKCHRRFNQDRLLVHQPSCHPPKPKKQVYEARKPDFDESVLRTPLQGSSVGGTPRLPPGTSGARSTSPGVRSAPSPSPSRSDNFPRCKVCNRTFAPDRIERHEMNCHAPPLKKKEISNEKSSSQGSKLTSTKCNSCGEALIINAKFCTACGEQIQPKCRACGETFPEGAKFCGKCGQPIQGNKNNDDKTRLRMFSIDSYNSFDQFLPKILRPRTQYNVICYICGEDYGEKSITIHEKNCLERWALHNNQLPRNRRISLPRRPIVRADRISYNRAARSMSEKHKRGFPAPRLKSNLTPTAVCVRQEHE